MINITISTVASLELALVSSSSSALMISAFHPATLHNLPLTAHFKSENHPPNADP